MFRENRRIDKSPSLPVRFKEHAWDAKVKALGRKGFFSTTIHRAMPELTLSQIRYRLAAANIRPNLFRSGQSDEARDALKKVDQLITSCQFERRNIAGVLRNRDTHGRRRPVKMPTSA